MCIWGPTRSLFRVSPLAATEPSRNSDLQRVVQTGIQGFLLKFQVERRASAACGSVTGGSVSKTGLHTARCRLHALPPVVACSHLFVSVLGLTITSHIYPFHAPSSPVLLQPWPGRPFHSSARAATQTAEPSPRFFRNSFCTSSRFRRPQETRKRESMCNRRRHAEGRESESRVEAHQRRKKPDLLSPKKESTADVCMQILPLPPIMETHATICSALPSFLPYAHIYKHAD